jgi:hypothetical protein
VPHAPRGPACCVVPRVAPQHALLRPHEPCGFYFAIFWIQNFIYPNDMLVWPEPQLCIIRIAGLHDPNWRFVWPDWRFVWLKRIHDHRFPDDTFVWPRLQVCMIWTVSLYEPDCRFVWPTTTYFYDLDYNFRRPDRILWLGVHVSMI